MAMAEAGCAVQAACGGCPLLSLERSAETTTKAHVVSAKLAAVGIDVAVRFDEVPARFGYRNRLRMKVVDGRADFFNEAKRDGCPVVTSDLWEAIEHLRTVTSHHTELLGSSEYLEVRVGDDGGLGLVVPVPLDLAPLREKLGPSWVVAHSGMDRPPTLQYIVGEGLTIDVPITSFVQVNSDVNRRLVAKVLAVAEQVRATSFIDLFCGAGNFAVPLARQGLTGTAIDNVGAAIAELQRSEEATEGHIRCIEGDARTILDQLAPTDLVIADPPRAGLQQSHSALARLVGDTLVLIGCKASTFATDVAALGADGLLLESVTAFDMFPGTNHIEMLAIFNTRAWGEGLPVLGNGLKP